MCPGVECLHRRGGAGQPSDPDPAVWQVTGAGPAPGTKACPADLCTVVTVAPVYKAPTMYLPLRQSPGARLGFSNGHSR